MRRFAVLAAALLPRIVVAFVTLGSVDAIHCLRNFVRMLDGVRIDTPYLPGIELVLWVSGVVTYYSPLPVLFPWKLAPLVADALIALLLFDATKGRRAGFVYALIPIPIIVACVHPQWESLFLYALLVSVLFADRKPALAGVALVASIIVKPVAVPLAILLLPRERRGALAFLGGGAAAIAVYVAILAATRTLPDLYGIVQYAGGGVQVFGLPFRPHNRLVPVVGALAVVSFLWFRRKCTRAEAVMLFFAISVGSSGLSVQYLAWIVPFAVLCRRWLFVALYTIAAGLFLFFYYLLPEINLRHVEDLGGFALLHPLGAFGPPPPAEWVHPLMQLTGNAVIPLLLLGFAAFEIVRFLAKPRMTPQEHAIGTRALIPAAAALVLFGIVMAWAAAMPDVDAYSWIARVEQRIGEYDAVRYRGPAVQPGMKVWLARTLLEPAAANRVVNVTTIGISWIALAAVAALIAALSSRANGQRDVA